MCDIEEAENEPRLWQDEVHAWRFYSDNATLFVRQYGLMPYLVEKCGLSGVALDIFMQRLSVIHSAILEMAVQNASRKPLEEGNLLIGSDNV